MRFTYFGLRVFSEREIETVMNKILVQWTDGRLKGTTSFVKRSAIKKGKVAVGRKSKLLGEV